MAQLHAHPDPAAAESRATTPAAVDQLHSQSQPAHVDSQATPLTTIEQAHARRDHADTEPQPTASSYSQITVVPLDDDCTPRQYLDNIKVDRRRHQLIEQDTYRCWREHRDAKTTVDTLLQTGAPAAKLSAAISAVDRALTVLQDHNWLFHASKANLEKKEADVDLVAVAYPEVLPTSEDRPASQAVVTALERKRRAAENAAMVAGRSPAYVRKDVTHFQVPTWALLSPVWNPTPNRKETEYYFPIQKHHQADLRLAALMVYWQVIHGPITMARLPPPGVKLEDRDVGRLLSIWTYDVTLLAERWPGDFASSGMPHAHRHQFGLPFTADIDGRQYAVVVGGSYPLCGSGYLVANMKNYKGVLSNEELTATTKPWTFGLKTKHSQGKSQKTLVTCTMNPDRAFPIDPAYFHMPTMVDRDYITDAEVDSLRNDPGVPRAIKTALYAPENLARLAVEPQAPIPILSKAGKPLSHDPNADSMTFVGHMQSLVWGDMFGNHMNAGTRFPYATVTFSECYDSLHRRREAVDANERERKKTAPAPKPRAKRTVATAGIASAVDVTSAALAPKAKRDRRTRAAKRQEQEAAAAAARVSPDTPNLNLVSNSGTTRPRTRVETSDQNTQPQPKLEIPVPEQTAAQKQFHDPQYLQSLSLEQRAALLAQVGRDAQQQAADQQQYLDTHRHLEARERCELQQQRNEQLEAEQQEEAQRQLEHQKEHDLQQELEEHRQLEAQQELEAQQLIMAQQQKEAITRFHAKLHATTNLKGKGRAGQPQPPAVVYEAPAVSQDEATQVDDLVVYTDHLAPENQAQALFSQHRLSSATALPPGSIAPSADVENDQTSTTQPKSDTTTLPTNATPTTQPRAPSTTVVPPGSAAPSASASMSAADVFALADELFPDPYELDDEPPSSSPSLGVPAVVPDDPLLKEAIHGMSQLGIYSFGSIASLSVEADDISELVRAAGLPGLAGRISRMSNAARQAGRNVHCMTTAVVPIVEAAATQGRLTSAPFISSDFTVEAIADTLQLRTLADAQPDLVTRYHRAAHQAAPLPPSAQMAFRQAAATVVHHRQPITNPEALQTAATLTTRFGATLPSVEGRKRHTVGRAPATFQSIFRITPRDGETSGDRKAKVGKSHGGSSPTASAAADGHERVASDPFPRLSADRLRRSLTRSYTDPTTPWTPSET